MVTPEETSRLVLLAEVSPLRLSRTGSIRNSMHSSVQALHRSVVGSLSKRNSIRSEIKSTPSQCEILVEDYSMGAYDDWRPATAFHEEEEGFERQLLYTEDKVDGRRQPWVVNVNVWVCAAASRRLVHARDGVGRAEGV